MMRMLQVIIFGDEKGISQVDLMKLHSVGFEILFSGMEGGIELILQKKPDIVFINKSTKGIDSIGLCNKIHTLFHIPVIIISDRADEIDCILGLEIGADDYITRPFSMDEFILRIKNILWRYQKKNSTTNVSFSKPNLHLDEDKHSIFLNGNELLLTNSEFILLSSLINSPKRIFSRDRLCQLIAEKGKSVSVNSISGHIKNIKKKLSIHAPGQVFIRSVYGEGYYWSGGD